jgi:hypothetical protein
MKAAFIGIPRFGGTKVAFLIGVFKFDFAADGSRPEPAVAANRVQVALRLALVDARRR